MLNYHMILTFRRFLLISSLASVCFLLSSTAHAQSQTLDVRPQSDRVTGDDLTTYFSGVTHDGAYNFDLQGKAGTRYLETHKINGRVRYEEDNISAVGNWAIINDRLCYSYNSENMSGGCFRVYKLGTCFYFYSSEFIETKNEIDRNYWTARSVKKGDETTCENLVM